MPSSLVDHGHFISTWAASPLVAWSDLAPWQLTTRSVEIVQTLVDQVAHDDGYAVRGDIAIHRTAIVEASAVLKGPLVVGPGGLIAAGAYVRGGCWIDTTLNRASVRPAARSGPFWSPVGQRRRARTYDARNLRRYLSSSARDSQR